MSVLTRLLNRFRPASLESDLHDEVQFHLDKRAGELIQSGWRREEAMKRAHDEFGDVEATKKGMRRARLTSVPAFVGMTTLLAVIAVFWMSRARLVDVSIPEPPAPPIFWDVDLDGPHRTPPPPPPPPPTREQCLEQAKRVPRVCG